MVLRGVARKEAFARRGDVGVSDVGQDGCRAVWGVLDDACAEFVGGAFESEGDVGSVWKVVLG